MVSYYLINSKHKIGFYVGCIDNNKASDETNIEALEQFINYKEYCGENELPLSSDVLNYIFKYFSAMSIREIFASYLYLKGDGNWEVIDESNPLLEKIKIID